MPKPSGRLLPAALASCTTRHPVNLLYSRMKTVLAKKPPVGDPPETTRQALIEAATTIFAEQGYARGSVRLITRAAGANQAAITYHFGGKDELYRTVLRQAVAAFEQQSLINEQNVMKLDRATAVRLTIRDFLLPLIEKGRLGRYVQIFGWENVDPSPVYTAFLAEETPRIFVAVELLVRRFLPAEADAQQVALTAFWLVQQPIAIVRNAERLQGPPHHLRFDDAAIDAIVDRLTALSLHGLERL